MRRLGKLLERLGKLASLPSKARLAPGYWQALVLFLVMLLSFTVAPLLYRAYLYTVAPPVPSGDDPATHIYIALRVAGDYSSVLYWRVFGNTSVPLQYPNIVHVALAVVYTFTGSVDLLVDIVKLYEFIMVAAGFILYASLVYSMLAGVDDSYKRVALIAVYLGLAAVMSKGVMHTLKDGNVMELTDILILLPILIHLLTRNRCFSSGFIVGLSSLNILGFIEVLSGAAPWIMYSIVKRRWRSLALFLVGVLFGGNLFLARIVYKVFTGLLIPLLFGAEPPGAVLVPGLAIDKFASIERMYTSIHLFYIVVASYAVFAAVLLASINGRQHCCVGSDCRYALLLSALWLFHTTALFGADIIPLSIASVLVNRLARVNVFLAAIGLTANMYLLVRIIVKCSTPVRRGMWPTLLFVLIFVLVIVISIAPGLYNSLYDFKGLIRADSLRLETYRELRNFIIDMGARNTTIAAISQVSSWLRAYLTIPERGVDVYLVTTPEIYSRYARNDLNRLYGIELYKALTTVNGSLLRELGVKFIAAELPNENQWYHESVKGFAYTLLTIDYRLIGRLVYVADYGNRGVGLRFWELKSNDSLILGPIRLGGGDAIVYHRYGLGVNGGFLALNVTGQRAGGEAVVIGLVLPSSDSLVYVLRKGYDYWVRFRSDRAEGVFVSRDWRTHIVSVGVSWPQYYLVNASYIREEGVARVTLVVDGVHHVVKSKRTGKWVELRGDSSVYFVGSFPTAKGVVEEGEGLISYVLACGPEGAKEVLVGEFNELVEVGSSEGCLIVDPSVIRAAMIDERVGRLLGRAGVTGYSLLGNASFSPVPPFIYVIRGVSSSDSVALIGFPIGSDVEFIDAESGSIVERVAVTGVYERVYIRPGIYIIAYRSGR